MKTVRNSNLPNDCTTISSQLSEVATKATEGSDLTLESTEDVDSDIDSTSTDNDILQQSSDQKPQNHDESKVESKLDQNVALCPENLDSTSDIRITKQQQSNDEQPQSTIGTETTCQTDENQSKERPVSRKVSWGNIEMHLHPVIVGDHPETIEGPPITIGWKRFAVHTFDIDGFESTRPPRYKDMGKDLRICCTDRLQLLQRIGTHHDEITAATRISSIVRKHRQRTRERCSIVDEIKEKIFRKLAKAIYPERRIKLITRY